MPNDTPIGTLDVVWYLKFRRRTPAAYAGWFNFFNVLKTTHINLIVLIV